MTGGRLQPTPLKRLVPKKGALDLSAILPVCPKISDMDVNRRNRVRLFKIIGTKPCIGMSKESQEGDSNTCHQIDWFFKPAP